MNEKERQVFENLLSRAKELNHLVAEDESRYEQWVHESDTLENAITEAEKVLLGGETMQVFVYYGNPEDIEVFSSREKAEEGIAKSLQKKFVDPNFITVIAGTKVEFDMQVKLEQADQL